MNSNDIIMVNVVGTNGSTRQQRTISARFNGQGFELNDKGQAVSESPVLTDLPGSGATPAPAFPQDEYSAAGSDAEKIKQVMLAHAERVTVWQQSQTGGSEEVRIAKAVLNFLVKVHQFITEDGEGFVVKLENIDVKRDTLKDGRSLFLATGTAVFGVEASSWTFIH